MMIPVLTYDTETTGLPDWKNPSDSPEQPHLVQLGAILADGDTGETISSLDVIVRPDGWEIPQAVVDIHGITTEYAEKVGVPEPLAVKMLLEMADGAERVAHNRTFDQRIIRIATKRYFSEEIIDAWANKEDHHCTMLMAKPIMQLPPYGRYGYKSPSLAQAYEHFTGKQIEDAHSAIADARACKEVYFAIQERERADTGQAD